MGSAPGGPRSRGRAGGTRPAPVRGMARPGVAPAALKRLLDRQDWKGLDRFLGLPGVDVTQARERLRRFAEQVVEWNRGRSNLISRNDEERIVDRHMRESIEVAGWLAEAGATRWLDLGSGAGFPAIPLALAGVPGRWTLVESRRMKTLFMAKAMQDIGLSGIELVRARLEHLLTETDRLSDYDGFTSRATMGLGETLILAASFVAPGGVAFLWKGSRREEEMAGDAAWKKSWDYQGLRGVGLGQNAVVKFIRSK